MKKVITYGTFDLLHYGHINLLKRAKSLGDYLIVGVTSPLYDMQRGKVNLQQSLVERIKALEMTGLIDEIIVEEYEGQKIDDIQKYNVDIFVIGSDWKGHFDYLSEYCKVIYLDRTIGISSTDIRSNQIKVKLGIYTDSNFVEKIINEINIVNGMEVINIYFDNTFEEISTELKPLISNKEDNLIKNCDVIYVYMRPEKRYKTIKKILSNKKHVITESPFSLLENECIELFQIAEKNNVILFDCLKTAYSFAFRRLVSIAKSGIIGEIKYISANCSTLEPKTDWLLSSKNGGGMYAWGAYVSLVVFFLLGKKVKNLIFEKTKSKEINIDDVVKIDFVYDNAIASGMIAVGVKTESDLVIAGSKGYIYVPSPWWKTEFFEIRYEDSKNNRKCYYQLYGEGIKEAFIFFMNVLKYKTHNYLIPIDATKFIAFIFENYTKNT